MSCFTPAAHPPTIRRLRRYLATEPRGHMRETRHRLLPVLRKMIGLPHAQVCGGVVGAVVLVVGGGRGGGAGGWWGLGLLVVGGDGGGVGLFCSDAPTQCGLFARVGDGVVVSSSS